MHGALFVVTNAIFLVAHPVLAARGLDLPPIVDTLLVGLALFVLPGLGWARCLPTTSMSPGLRAAMLLGASTGVFLVALGLLVGAGWDPTSTAGWNVLWLSSNAGLIAALRVTPARESRDRLRRTEITVGVACFAAAFVLFFWGATRVVPPLEDQDLEVTGTGYGLLTRFEPRLLSDRHTLHFFAHPPLLHFQVAGSFLLHGALADLRVYDDLSRRALLSRTTGDVPGAAGRVDLHGHPSELPVPAGTYAITGTDGADYLLAVPGEDTVRVPVETVELDRIYAHYARAPRQLESRTPNIFFGALTVALLALWAGRISGRVWIGVLVAGVYATSPEVFVRSSYGGYYAIGALASVFMLVAHDDWRRSGGRAVVIAALVTGIFAALADHKLALLPLALGGLALIAPPRTTPGLLPRLHPVAIGFGIGTLLFWAWGFVIDPQAFVADHLRGHLVDRVLHHNPFGYSGYLSRPGLWREFNDHTNWLLVLGTGLLCWDYLRARLGRVADAPGRAAWLLWMALTVVAFTAVDWRMTKHVATLALPIALALAPDAGAPRRRLLVAGIGGLVILAANIIDVAALARDFTSFTITPLW